MTDVLLFVCSVKLFYGENILQGPVQHHEEVDLITGHAL